MPGTGVPVQNQLGVTMGAPMGNPQTPLSQGNPNPATSQPPNSQQGIMMSQTNTMAMGGGQITQNVVTSTSQNQPNVNLLGQVNQSTMSPRMCQVGFRMIYFGVGVNCCCLFRVCQDNLGMFRVVMRVR